MALTERFRSGGSRGIAGFLAEHQKCDAGFDVGRRDDPGTGRLTITCKGCGARANYTASEAARVVTPELLLANAPSPERSQGGTAVQPSPEKKARSRRRSTKTTRRRKTSLGPAATALIAAAIAAGVALIVVALFGDDGKPVTTTAPSAATTGGAGGGGETAVANGNGNRGGTGEKANPGQRAKPRPVLLAVRSGTGPFSIAVPISWRDVEVGSVANYIAPGGTAFIQVYYESGAQDPSELARGAAGYLRRKHPGARISTPRSTRIDGYPAKRVVATYADGAEEALVLSSASYSYLVINRTKRAAPERIARAARAAARSMRPA